MSTLQIRNMPSDVHQILKKRAALSRKSLSEYALEQLAKSTHAPTLEELDQRIKSHDEIVKNISTLEILREIRSK